MKRYGIIVFAVLLALTGAVMVQAQETATPEPTQAPTTDPNAQPTAEPTVEPTAEPLPVWVRVVNWSADNAAVDILVDEAVSFANIAGAAGTEYQTFVAGEHAFTVVAAGQAVDSATANIQLADWDEGERITIAVVGSAANGTLTAVASQDDFSPIPFGSARLWVYHAVEGLGNVDVFANGDMVVTELGYPGSFTDLNGQPNDGAFAVDVPAGTYDISISLTADSAVTGDSADGTTDTTEDGDDSGDADETTETVMTGLVNLPQFALDAGQIYTIAVVGTADAPTTFVSSQAGVALPQPSALDVAQGNPDFSVLSAAVRNADPSIGELLGAGGDFTVFAPTNAAFDSFLNDMAMTTDDLFANPDVLNTVLRYHVVQGRYDAATLAELSGQTLVTLNGEPINIAVDETGTLTLNGVATVLTADTGTSTGLVHIVDAVLVPPSVQQ